MSTVKANKWLHSDGTETTEVDVPSLDQRMAKAWCRFNGFGTVAVRDSYNISSITDNGTGNYNVNFAAALPNDDYSVGGMTVSGGGVCAVIGRGNSTLTTTYAGIATANSAGFLDRDLISVNIFSN